MINRRAFLAAGGAAAIAGGRAALADARGAAAIDETLRGGAGRRGIPAVVAMAASASKTLYAGAFGRRDSSGPPVTVDSIFSIASMTKPITTVAALQLVEQGKIALDEPVVRHLPQFEGIQVLEGFDADGKARLRPPATQPTVRHLLTHTSGLCYDLWDEKMFRYASQRPPGSDTKPGPLMFEPGMRWQYGQGLDWAGRLVEAVSGMTLEAWFQEHILRPLGMKDTSYILPEARFERLVSNYQREKSGELRQEARKLPNPPKSFNGGGGLYSTAGDYVRFMQMVLNEGKGPGGVRILRPETVRSMKTNRIGALTAGKMKSYRPELSSDVDMQPGHTEKWGLGFLINTTPYDGGRAAGSLAWAGLLNTFFWIDPERSRCGVILMQFLPFVDKEAVGMLDDFERAIYRANFS